MLLALLLASSALGAKPAVKGDTWESLAKVAYGSAHYGPVLATFNGKAGVKLTPGTEVTVPDMEAGVAKLQMEGAFEGLVRQLGNAGTALAGVEAELNQLRPKKKGETVTLPGPLQLRVQRVLNAVDIARSGTAATELKYAPPKKAVADLDAAVLKLNALREGKLDPKGDDLQRVHKHIADAMLEIIRWYRAGFR